MKDFKSIKFTFDCDTDESNSILFNNQKQTTLREVQVKGDFIKPAQLKLVNSTGDAASQNFDSNLLFCLDEMESDDDDTDEPQAEKKHCKKQFKYAARSQNLNLFRRRLKHKKFLELDDDEGEKLSATVLDFDKFKDKSLFQFVCENKLVLPSDYDAPDFISLDEPVDTSYGENYSQESPSVHELFDINIELAEEPAEEPAEDNKYGVEETEYEMMEYIEEDDDDL